MGELIVDLRDTDLPGGDVPLDIEVGVGEARVIVPDDVCVATDADIGMGNVHLFGRDHGGVDVDFEDCPDAKPATTRLLLHADVGMGELRVQDSRGDFYFDDHRFGRFEDAPHSTRQSEACAATGERAASGRAGPTSPRWWRAWPCWRSAACCCSTRSPCSS